MDLSGLEDDFRVQWEETVGYGLEWNDGELNQGDIGGGVSREEADYNCH